MSQSDIVISQTLEGYVYSQLNAQNQKLYRPLKESLLVYGAQVVEKYATTQSYNLPEALGIQFLTCIHNSESGVDSHLNPTQKIQRVAEVSLLNSSVFSRHRKIQFMGEDYYGHLAAQSYFRLNGFIPVYLDQANFYRDFSLNLFLIREFLKQITL
jgi:hypothetical protein